MNSVMPSTVAVCRPQKLNAFIHDSLYTHDIIEQLIRYLMAQYLQDDLNIEFYKYLMRHGEFWLQDIVERIERYEGVLADSETPLPLKDRWNALMRTQAA
jgi:hypothetical protein